MQSFGLIQQHVTDKLQQGLSPRLAYHNVHHTLDVMKQAEYIAHEEGMDDEHALLLLKVAALYHDVGFIETYFGHEERSCQIALPELEQFGFSSEDIDSIVKMIMATRVPQQPAGFLQQVLCDADLDYLGRHDFFTKGEGLYKEFMDQRIVHDYNEWNELQVRFLESHSYFTATSRRRRQAQKMMHLQAVKQKMRMSA